MKTKKDLLRLISWIEMDIWIIVMEGKSHAALKTLRQLRAHPDVDMADRINKEH